MSEQVSADTVVSHTDESGRTLSGVGVDVDKLAETMERHAPKEPEAPAKSEPAAQPAQPSEPQQPVSRGRQRFSDLTRERDEAKAAAEKERADREALARELEELRAKASQPSQPATETEKPAEPAKPEPTRPMPTEDEIGTKYQTYAEFVRDMARWELEQERATFDPSATVREILAQERARQEFHATLTATHDRGRKAYPDFDALLSGPNGKIPLGQTRESAIDRVYFIAKHPQSEHIQYAILKDAAVAQRLQQASDYEFGTIVSSLVPAAPAKAPTWTPPPPPHPTVGASSPTTPASHAELAKKGGQDFDSSGYRERRARELGRKPRW